MKILIIPSAEIVFGNQLSPKDTVIRCKAGLKLWQNKKFDFLILTGGIFTPNQTIPAASIMRLWFLNKGVNAKFIITEDASLDTFENVKNSLEVLEQHGLAPVELTVVTQWQHAIRFWITGFFGYRIKIRLKPQYYHVPLRVFIRECMFILYHLYDPLGTKKLAKLNRAQRRQPQFKV